MGNKKYLRRGEYENMPLETNIEYRKRQMLNYIIRQQQKKLGIINQSANKLIERMSHYLIHPRNFSDLNTILSWFDKYLSEESKDTQLILRDFFEKCLIQYELDRGNKGGHFETKKRIAREREIRTRD